jgi:hypothetical protein
VLTLTTSRALSLPVCSCLCLRQLPLQDGMLSAPALVCDGVRDVSWGGGEWCCRCVRAGSWSHGAASVCGSEAEKGYRWVGKSRNGPLK